MAAALATGRKCAVARLQPCRLVLAACRTALGIGTRVSPLATERVTGACRLPGAFAAELFASTRPCGHAHGLLPSSSCLDAGSRPMNATLPRNPTPTLRPAQCRLPQRRDDVQR